RAVMMVRGGGDLDVHLGGAEVAAAHLVADEVPAGEIETVQCVSERLERRAGVDERAHDHVPCRPARAVEVRDAGHGLPDFSGDAPPTTGTRRRGASRTRRPTAGDRGVRRVRRRETGGGQRSHATLIRHRGGPRHGPLIVQAKGATPPSDSPGRRSDAPRRSRGAPRGWHKMPHLRRRSTMRSVSPSCSTSPRWFTTVRSTVTRPRSGLEVSVFAVYFAIWL